MEIMTKHCSSINLFKTKVKLLLLFAGHRQETEDHQRQDQESDLHRDLSSYWSSLRFERYQAIRLWTHPRSYPKLHRLRQSTDHQHPPQPGWSALQGRK